MVVSKKTMHFREERAAQLEQMAILLTNCIGNVNTGPIYQAISQLKDENKIPSLKGGKIDAKVWGYDIEDFVIPLESLKHVQPHSITDGSVIVNMKLRADVDVWEDMSDPFLELNFNVHIKGIGDKVYHFGFHIDRHDIATTPDEPHPVYHIQYNINPTNANSFDYGSTLYVDTPRLLHFPLDFILGVSFLTSNFFPTAYSFLIEDRAFRKMTAQYQERIFKPYFHTLANHWKPFSQAEVTWQPISHLCPIFL